MALPPYVSPNELILSAWGNNVVDELARLTADTGWTNIAPTGNWSGICIGRRIGSLITLNFTLSKVGADFGPGTIAIANLPVAFRPSVSVYGLAFVTGPTGFCRLVAGGAAGTLEAQQLTINGGGPVVSGSLAYPITLP